MWNFINILFKIVFIVFKIVFIENNNGYDHILVKKMFLKIVFDYDIELFLVLKPLTIRTE